MCRYFHYDALPTVLHRICMRLLTLGRRRGSTSLEAYTPKPFGPSIKSTP